MKLDDNTMVCMDCREIFGDDLIDCPECGSADTIFLNDYVGLDV